MGDIDVQAVYCRVCGIKCKKAVKIFSGKGQGMGLREKILKCLLMSVKKSDQLPKRICYTCIDRLDEFSQFNLLAKQAQVKLKTLLKVQGVHVKEEKNYELISTWKALLASQEWVHGKGSSKGRKRKRKSEIRLDVSSESDTTDSTSDSDSPFQTQHAVLPSSNPVLNDNFSLLDSSLNYANQRNASTSTTFISSFGGNNQERNLSSSITTHSTSVPPKEEISSPIRSSQIMPVSRDMIMPYQQQAPSIDNSFTSAPSSQPLVIPSQIPNSVFLFNRHNIQSQNVGRSPLYVVNLAYNSSDSAPSVSQLNNNCNTNERTSPSPTDASLGKSFSSILPPNSTHSTNLPHEQNQNVFTSQTASLISEPSPLVGRDASVVTPPHCPVDHLQRSHTSGDLSKESQTILETTQGSVKDTINLGKSHANYPDISSCTVPCDIDSSTNRNTFKNPQNISSKNNLLSPNPSIVSRHDKPPDSGFFSQFSDISDVEDVRETVGTPNDLPCGESSSLSTPRKDIKKIPSAGLLSKVTSKAISHDPLSDVGDSPHSLTNITIAPNKENFHADSSLVMKSSIVESKECTALESKSYTPHSEANLRVSDNSKPGSVFKEKLVSKKCEKVKDPDSLKDCSLIMAENNKEDYLKIVSDTEADNAPLEEVRKELVSEAKSSLQELSAISKEREAEELFSNSIYSAFDHAIPRKLFISENSSSFSIKQVEVPINHVPSEINTQISLKMDASKDVTLLKEDLSRKGLSTQQPDTSTSEQSPQKAMPEQEMGKFKCELCSRHNPTFFSHVTDAIYHHQIRHHGVGCLFSCSKCSFVTEELQNLRQHILSSCMVDKSPSSEKSDDENPVPKIKKESSQDYEQALLNLKNALLYVSMPRFNRLLKSCKAVLSPEESGGKVDSSDSFSTSSPSCSTINRKISKKSECQQLDLKCYFCYSSFKSKAELQAHSKICPSPEKGNNCSDSPPAKKFKPIDVLNSSFTREGSYYSCIQCGKNCPSAFKAKMHATRSKSCRRTDQNTSRRNVESKVKSPDFNLPSTFRKDHHSKMKESQAITSQPAISKGSSMSSDSGLNSDMVFDIPCIKVEREETDEEVLDVESVGGEKSVAIGNSCDDKGGRCMRDLGTVSTNKKLIRVREEKESKEKVPLHVSATKTKVTQPEESIDFDLGKVKVEKSEETPSDCVILGDNLSKDSRKNTRENSNVKQGCGVEKILSPSKKSFTNIDVDFNLSVVRQFSTPFQVLRPEDSPVVIRKGNCISAKKISPMEFFTNSSNEATCSSKPVIDPTAESVKKLTTSVSKTYVAQEVKKSTGLADSTSKERKTSFRLILPKPSIPFRLNVNDKQKKSSHTIFGTPIPIRVPSTSIGTPSTSIGTSSTPIGTPNPIGTPSTPTKALSTPIVTPSTPVRTSSIQQKSPSGTPKEESKNGNILEKNPAVSSSTSSRTTNKSLESSPSKAWLKNAEKYCMNKTQSNDPNRGLVLKVPLVRLTRLRLLNNGEVDISGIEFGNGRHQQPSSSSPNSGKCVGPINESAKEGSKALVCKEEPMEEESILGS